MSQKVIVVGGVAGGASCVARLRRLDETADIVLFEKGEYISFANCGLPYYIGGVIENRDALLVQTVEGLSSRFNLKVHNNTEVLQINREKKTVQVKNRQSGESWEESYDKLVLSTGSAPIRPPIPGLDEAKQVFTLRNIPDTDAIYDFIKEKKPQHATVVGGGFIGLEMAENLRHVGLKVTLLEAADQVMAPVDPELAAELHMELRRKGVELILSDGVDSFTDEGKKLILKSGKEVTTDMTILAIGVRPDNHLAVEAGLNIGERGGVQVNAQLQTNDPDIYAIGDVIEVQDFIQGTPAQIPLAGPANRQGRMVANHICGHDISYPGTLGSSVAKVFDLTVAATGSNEKTLIQLAKPYQAIHISPPAHAGYYPGAAPLSLKALYNPENGAIYGAQCVGYENVDKAIDTIATAIFAGISVYELADLELTYAPPFSLAKNPVNFIGYIAQNLRDGLKTADWSEVDELAAKGATIIDVSTSEEHQAGHLPGAKNIPLDDLRQRLNEIPKDEPVYIHCAIGLRGYIGARILAQNGYEAINISGGLRTYNNYKKQDQVEAEDQLLTTETEATAVTPAADGERISLDCTGLQCPGPLVQVNSRINDLAEGDILSVSVSDPGFTRDVKSWCRTTGNTFIAAEKDGKSFRVDILKGKTAVAESSDGIDVKENKDGVTLIVFSGDFDKVMAAFVIANGAAAMGKRVTMFFTFWGLNALRRHAKVEKAGLEKLFGMMMPEGVSKLNLSKMNMAGLGTKLMKRIMNDKNVTSLEELVYQARQAGVQLIACTMSMDVMGIRKEELLPGVELAGVGTYLGEAENSGTNLFI